ncbi:gfo/Idh/MocA family oxidoreductase [Mycolicibacterium sp. P1-18]|uniref:Gfo/Idh/MocA family protein n=1 Tax=Mycolicibacterium sp. P1-18 TaxID=2024615 RepID=UPI0011F2536E|nr:Gfo/Idh/MocA family oxidoreductase [Mycolicibacterium sp. P1-18]KAA0098123.1 gfo/Idh/MocA family oxidoreductase [Mycolicibacterium sp. P1-18]
MDVAIIGCGLIGQKRANLLGTHRLVAAVDADHAAAQKVSELRPGSVVLTDWRAAVDRADVDAVLVCTPHHLLAPVAIAAAEAGKHVLVEKPGARNAAELGPLTEVARRRNVVVKVGFNHRFHPALQRARKYVDDGAVGELMFLRARYGHGGRVGYDKEWRADPDISGGGELLDQGMHLIDLSRWFLGDFTYVDGFTHTYFWDMPVDDNSFMALRTARRQMAWLHVSWTEWKNSFSFELYGKTGKLHVEGLGGSYGTERLSFYRMSPEMGPPETVIHEYPGADQSWALEFADFVRSVETGAPPCGGLDDALQALTVVDAIYRADKA